MTPEGGFTEIREPVSSRSLTISATTRGQRQDTGARTQ